MYLLYTYMRIFVNYQSSSAFFFKFNINITLDHTKINIDVAHF